MRPTQDLPSSSPWSVHSGITPSQKPVLFSDPANNRLESPLGSPAGFLVRGSRMLPFLSSLQEKKCLTLPRLGTAQSSTRELTLTCRPMFWSTSGGDHLLRSHQVPVSSKGREISDKNRTGPPGTLASSQQQAARALALLLLSTLPIQVVQAPKSLPFFLVPFSLLLWKVRPSEQERKFSYSCMTLGC